MTEDLRDLSWPLAELGVALDALARRSKLTPRPVDIPKPPDMLADLTRAGIRLIRRPAAAVLRTVLPMR